MLGLQAPSDFDLSASAIVMGLGSLLPLIVCIVLLKVAIYCFKHLDYGTGDCCKQWIVVVPIWAVTEKLTFSFIFKTPLGGTY